MTTAQATVRLGYILDHGGDLWDEAESRADGNLRVARAHGKASNWSKAKAALDHAYRALGAEPDPATGYDWHCGSHPVQIAAARADREMREALGEV